jgi:GTP1/Obg family GTP-binding protein
MEKQGIAAFDFLDPIIVFLTDLTGTSGYSLQMQTNLRDELKLRYPNCEWVDVLSKNDLDFEDELGIDSAIKVSAYKDEGVDRLKDQLLNLIP